MDSNQDPWTSKDKEEEIDPDNNLSSESQSFEDNFDASSARLPDSDSYIAALEKRLSKLKTSKEKAGEDLGGKEILSTLQEFRESCMVRLISGSTPALISNSDLDLDSTLPKLPLQWIRNHLNIESALTVGEVLELLKADYLELNHSDAISETSEPQL